MFGLWQTTETTETKEQNEQKEQKEQKERKEDALLDAALYDRLAVVRSSFSDGVDVSCTNSFGSTPLHFAAFKGRLEIVRFLLENGANVQAKTNFLETPLHFASRSNDVEVVRLLVAHGADLDATNKYGKTALHLADEYGRTLVVHTLLESDKLLLRRRDRSGNTALHIAAAKGHATTVTTLLQIIKDDSCIGATNHAGESALFVAAAQGHVDVVNVLLRQLVPTMTSDDTASYKALMTHRKVLLAAQAHLGQCNAVGKTAFTLVSGTILDQLTAANTFIEAELSRLQQETQNKEAALAAAIAAHNWETTLTLLREGVSVLAYQDQEALVTAISATGNRELLRTLLSMVVEANDAIQLQSVLQQALAGAVANEKVLLVMDVLHTFANSMQVTTTSGPSPLHIAAKNGSLVLLSMLLASASLILDAINEEGYTALALAVQANHVGIALLLLSVGANVSIPLPDGSSVLHVAAELSNDDDDMTLLHAILEAPSLDINQVDADGYTVLARAVLTKREKLVHLFLDAGADATLPMRTGQTLSILATAAQRRHQEIATYLNDHVYPVAAEVSMADLVQHLPLGNGNNGTVFRATYQGRDVALKVANRISVYVARDMREEMNNTAACRCPYVVPLLAAVDHASDAPKMVVEFMDLGDMHVQLAKKRKDPSKELPFTMMQVAWAIANALYVIHSLGKVHRDVKSLNIFISSIHGVKLGDFGTTEALRTLMTGDKGTGLWIAPEVFRQRGSAYEEERAYGTAADIYSFGIVLSELATGNEPYVEVAGDVKSTIKKIRENGLRPNLGQDCPRWLRKLATACWTHEPSTRPTAKMIIKYLAKRLYDPEVDKAFDDDDNDLTPDAMAFTTKKQPAIDFSSISEEP